jgi:hypothetical protein
MFQLPVSGIHVAIQGPTGVEDLLLQETKVSNAAMALTLIGRLAHAADGSAIVWDELSVTDGEALLLLLRYVTLGDLVRADVHCSAKSCAARVDVSFRIREYLAAHKRRTPGNVRRADAEGWFGLAGESIEFRLPTCGDLVAIEQDGTPYAALVRRCVKPADISGASRKKVERAMEALAPRLSQPMEGRCPECDQRLDFYFDVHSFVLRELRNHAVTVYQDVHLLALHYKWPEQTILELPRNRRTQYVEMLREQGVAA